jgi:hypothetical protein
LEYGDPAPQGVPSPSSEEFHVALKKKQKKTSGVGFPSLEASHKLTGIPAIQSAVFKQHKISLDG